MNIHTKWIAEIASVSLEQAVKIQNYINENLNLDWSEASRREMKKAIVQATNEMTG